MRLELRLWETRVQLHLVRDGNDFAVREEDFEVLDREVGYANALDFAYVRIERVRILRID